MENKVLKGEEVLRVQVLPGKFDYAKGTKMDGKQYQRFAFGGKVFISNDERFSAALESGDVAEIELGIDDEGLYSLYSWVSWTAKVNIRTKMMQYESITVENFKPSVAKSVGELEGLS